MRALILANGEIPRTAVMRSVAKGCHYVVCADGGARHALRLGIRPDVILGDLDSLTTAMRKRYRHLRGRSRTAPRIIHIPDQESTDLEKAISHCIRIRCAEAVVCGATGTRIDHSSLALGIFRKFRKKIVLSLVDRSGTVTMLDRKASIPLEPGDKFSLIPLGRCTGVTIRNARYPLSDEILETGAREGVSNEALLRQVTVRYRTGTLLLYRFHRPQERTAGSRRRR